MPEQIQVYLEHLSTLFHSLAYSGNLQAVLDYHASILRMVEADKVHWSRSEGLLLDSIRVNFLATLRATPAAPAAAKATKKEDAPNNSKRQQNRARANKITCDDYNTTAGSTCKKPGDHDSVRHVCWACVVYRDKEAPHPLADCPDKKPRA